MRRFVVAVILMGSVVALGGSAARDDIEALRAQGPAGLETLLEKHATQLSRGPQKTDQWKALCATLDTVAAQKDAYASRLYWYTDLNRAKAAAAKDSKPILSLRLLGRLDQDLSCANSRFFRTTLYPDPVVSNLLREKFVLHWSSERPVPVVTIDFGDGRVMKRTITGNSIHYVLDAEARPIDALPGLYSADVFVRKLSEAIELSSELVGLSGVQRDQRLQEWHRAAVDRTEAITPMPLSAPAQALIAAKEPPAEQAGRLAISKSFVEMPLVRSLRRLEDSIAQDTIQNETRLHRQLHEWFARQPVGSLDQLNIRVYAELFLTPRSDPWLGLAPTDAYSALDDAGFARR